MCASCPELGTPCKDCWVRAGYKAEAYDAAHGGKKAPTQPAPPSQPAPESPVGEPGRGLGPDLKARLDKDIANAEADLRATSPGGDPDPNAPPANHDGDEPSGADVKVQDFKPADDPKKSDTRKDFPPVKDEDLTPTNDPPEAAPKTGPGRGSKSKTGG
jgi:hypothetical protein